MKLDAQKIEVKNSNEEIYVIIEIKILVNKLIN
jgi:hypothetical protein